MQRGGQRGGDRGAFRGGGRGGRGAPRGGGGAFRGGSGGGRGGRGGIQGSVLFTPSTPSDVNPQLVEAGDSLVASFKSLKVDSNSDLPLRPGYGTDGRPIKVRANYFSVKIPKCTLYEYRITYAPKVKDEAKRLKKRLLQILDKAPAFQQYKDLIAHDWNEKLICAKKLPTTNGKTPEFKVALFEEEEQGPRGGAKEYTIHFTFINEINSANLESYLNGKTRSYNIAPILSALNIVLAKYASSNGGIRVGRDRMFFKTGQSFALSPGLEAWKGFYSSVRPTLNQLMVNVNVCYTAFYKAQNLADAMIEFEDASFGGNIEKYIEGIRVRPKHLSYPAKKTVRRVISKGAGETYFPWEESNGKISVEKYFQRKYGINLQRPRLLVDVGNKERANYVPAELCDILRDQPFRGKLSDTHTAAMILHACNPPAVNARSIVNEGLGMLGYSPQSKSLSAFGITVSSQMTVVPARVLAPPQVAYAQQKSADINKDKASWNLQRVRFFRGMRLDNWGVFIVKSGNRDFSNPNDPELHATVKEFQGACEVSGMTVGPPKKYHGVNITNLSNNNDRVHQALHKELSQMKTMGFVLVILSNENKGVYAAIRRVCDVELGIPATCVQNTRIRKDKGRLQYMANVALKINAKLGGVNHALVGNASSWLAQKRTMLVGMDVTHPGPGSAKGTPSIAGVVASYDENHSIYPASIRLQESKKEMIDELAGMLVERLQLFKEKRKLLPERIIVFRDGVSEGQFVTVLREEYPKMLEAFRRFSSQAEYRPKLSIIICGKRHHTRFYPTTEDSADQLGNPKPGTVVDRGITAIYEFDFFLQAHAGLQGQVRPTHYTVVHDENKFGADAAQCLINYSCYTYARATKAVSLVPPAYYADLVCERGRCYIHDLLNMTPGSRASVESGDETEVFKQAQNLWGRGVHNNVAKSMFYL